MSQPFHSSSSLVTCSIHQQTCVVLAYACRVCLQFSTFSLPLVVDSCKRKAGICCEWRMNGNVWAWGRWMKHTAARVLSVDYANGIQITQPSTSVCSFTRYPVLEEKSNEEILMTHRGERVEMLITISC